jgi:hypothetical protein
LRFSSQNLPDMQNVSAEFIERAFDDKAIGTFAHLSLSHDVFIQAGSKGTPSNCVPPDDPLVKEHRSFIERTGSEPWTLQYIDGVARKEYQAQGYLTLEQVKTAFIEYLRTDGQWRQNHVWEELDTTNNPFPNPMPDETFELIETIPNDALRLDDLPAPDADGAEVWRLADTFNGFKHWGSFERCAEIADQHFYDQQRDSNLTELRTCLFFECRRWHHYGELPNMHNSPYIRGLVEKIREMVTTGRVE